MILLVCCKKTFSEHFQKESPALCTSLGYSCKFFRHKSVVRSIKTFNSTSQDAPDSLLRSESLAFWSHSTVSNHTHSYPFIRISHVHATCEVFQNKPFHFAWFCSCVWLLFFALFIHFADLCLLSLITYRLRLWISLHRMDITFYNNVLNMCNISHCVTLWLHTHQFSPQCTRHIAYGWLFYDILRLKHFLYTHRYSDLQFACWFGFVAIVSLYCLTWNCISDSIEKGWRAFLLLPSCDKLPFCLIRIVEREKNERLVRKRGMFTNLWINVKKKKTWCFFND